VPLIAFVGLVGLVALVVLAGLVALVVLAGLVALVVLVALTVLTDLDLVTVVSLRERGIWMELKVREGMVVEEKMLIDRGDVRQP
jgi:hypothetical protein